MKKYILVLALAMPLTAAAQFFDHFEGHDLAEHWRFSSEGDQWEHNVSDSTLSVTRLYPGGPGPRQVYIKSWFDPLADFEMTALMGWDEGQYHWLVVSVLIEDPFFLRSIGSFRYIMKPNWKGPLVTAWFHRGGSNSIAAPYSGMHEFRMTRTGDGMTAYFNGQLVHKWSGAVPDDASGIMFEFGGEADAQFAPLHVDMIQLVPEPVTLVILGIGAICTVLRRRRKR